MSSNPARRLGRIFGKAWSDHDFLPMDRRDIELDYSNMNTIPTYALYGERQSDGQSWLHWETINARSRLYGFRISAHRHDQLHQVLYLCGGSARVMLDGETVELTPPALVIIPPLTVHSFVFSTDVEGYVLTFIAKDVRSAIDDIGPEAATLMRPAVFRPVAETIVAQDIDRAVRSLVSEADHAAPGQIAALKARLMLLMVAAHRLDVAGSTPVDDRQESAVRRAREFLALVDRHYRDTRKIGFYAGKLGITPTHLNRVSRQVLGDTALAVIERRILLEARRYLQFSALSIKEIGILLGYPDPAYFSRFFTQRVGQGPQAVRDGLKTQTAE